MINLIKNKDYYGIALFMLFFVLVVYQKMISPTIGVFILVFLTDVVFNKKKYTFKFNWGLTLFILLFIWYAFNLSFAVHQNIGAKLLEYKMSFFIFPIIFSFKNIKLSFWQTIQGFLIGVLLFSLVSIIYYVVSNQSFSNISIEIFNLHPSYSSAYITVALFILTIGFIKKQINLPIWVFGFLIVLGIFMLFALISFAAILFFLLVTATLFFIYIFYKKGIIWSIISFVVIVTSFTFFVSHNQRLSYDYQTTKQTLSRLIENPDWFIERNKDAKGGSDIRVLMWMFAYEVIKEHPMGVGLGDIDSYLDEKVNKYDIDYLKHEHLNPHNQFLQIGIDTGVIGILFLIFIFIFLIYYSVKHKKYILLFIVSNLFFNCLFESMLQRQSGIIFYTLMISYALVYESKAQNNE